MEPFNLANIIYWTGITVIITLTTTTIGQWCRRRENLRWSIGYFLVFLAGIPLVVLGYWQANTWIGLFFGVGLSGAIKVGYEQVRAALEARQLRSNTGNADRR